MPEGEESPLTPIATYRGRQVEILHTFNILGDFVWKLPRFLESEEKLELEKLNAYFPTSSDPNVESQTAPLRRLRHTFEFNNIRHHFPIFMGAAVHVHVISTFEIFLLQICRDHERVTGISLSDFRGRDRSPSRLLDYVRSVSGKTAPDDFILRTAITLRNCLAHAGGLVAELRNETEVRRILAEKLFWPEEKKQRPPVPGHDDEPRLISTAAGERLFVPMFYAYWVCHRAKEHLVALSIEANPAIDPAG